MEQYIISKSELEEVTKSIDALRSIAEFYNQPTSSHEELLAKLSSLPKQEAWRNPESINETYERLGIKFEGHPLTCCGFEGCTREINEGILIERESDFICPCGKYTQSKKSTSPQQEKSDWSKETKMIMEGYGDDPKDFPYKQENRISSKEDVDKGEAEEAEFKRLAYQLVQRIRQSNDTDALHFAHVELKLMAMKSQPTKQENISEEINETKLPIEHWHEIYSCLAHRLNGNADDIRRAADWIQNYIETEILTKALSINSEEKEYKPCEHLNMSGRFCMDCGWDKSGNY